MALVRRRLETEELAISAQPFLRAATLLREAAAIVQRHPLRDSHMPARLLDAANRARDEEFLRISHELRHALEALRRAATEGGASGWVRR